MKQLSYFLISFLFLTLWLSCGPKAAEEEAATGLIVKGAQFPMEKDGLTVSVLAGSPAYSDAKLSLTSAKPDDAGAFTFDFNVADYKLGAQTPSTPANGLANSGKGQHIHFILDNGPYSAHYEPQAVKELSPGNHVVLAFLSRSYHESVKNANSYVLTQYKVGDEPAEQADLNQAHMFYSRPKGTYIGKDTKRLMLDFFLINTDLATGGNTVKATINGTTFTFDKWQPYVIEGLPMGEVTVKLELLDAAGNLVPSPFNPVERVVTLKAEQVESEA